MAKKGKKIIVTLAALGTAAAGIFAGYKLLGQDAFNHSDNDHKVLNVVKNINYNEKENLFTWDSVDHATSYLTNINGQEQKVDTNEMYYVPMSTTTEFKVKAIDETGTYATPGTWSTYTYTLDNTKQVSFSSVSSYISKAMYGDTLKKVVSAYVEDNSLYSDCYFVSDGEDQLISISLNYDTEVNSIYDCLNNKYDTVSILHSYSLSPYESASYLLKSNSFDGEMEQRRLEGYEFSVVSSQATKMENDIFNIFATYKLTKGDDVKYIQSNMLCYITNPSNEKANYTSKLTNPDNVKLREYSYHELKGDEIDFAKSMEGVKQNDYTVDNGYEL